MRKLVFIWISLLLVSAGTKAQTFYTGTEYGISLGGSQYFGDLNDRYGFQTINPAVGGFTRIHINPFIATRIGVDLTRVSYDDKLSSNVFNQKRNLNFTSNIIEGHILAEFNFFRFMTGEQNSRWTPYLVGGIGFFYYNPTTTLNGRRYDLIDLGTEGQFAGYGERGYTNFSFNVPVGAGFKYWIKPGVNLGFEIANRITFTDYLDDVSATYVGADQFDNRPGLENAAYFLQDRSIEMGEEALGRAGKQRGNSSSTDHYLMFTFKVSFQLKTYRCPTYLKQGYYY